MALPRQCQFFLQALLDAGAVPAKKAAELYNECGEKVTAGGRSGAKSVADDGTGLVIIADTINKKLSRFGLALRTVYSPWEQAAFWGIANVEADNIARLGTDMPAPHVAFFYSALDELMEREGEMKLVELQNHVLEQKLGVKVGEAGKLINRLNREGWLKIIKNRNQGGSRVTYGVRTLLEIPNVRASVLSMKNAVTTDDVDEDMESDGGDQQDEDQDEEEEEEDDVVEPVSKRRRSNRRNA